MKTENKVWTKYSLILIVASSVSLRVQQNFFEVSAITASSVTLGIAIALLGAALTELSKKI